MFGELGDSLDIQVDNLLSKINVNKYISVDIDLDELDLTKAEGKANYNEIKKYVYEHFELKVSNLNIAKMKDKYGIKERICYNHAKKEKSKQPNCP